MFVVGVVIRGTIISEHKADVRKEAMGFSLFGSTSTVDRELAKAEEALKNGQTEIAKECAFRVIKDNPKCAKAYVILGKAQGFKDDKLSISYFTDAIAIDPKYVDAYSIRALTYYIKGTSPKHKDSKVQNLSLAIADYTKVIELSPEDAEAYKWRGNSFRHLHDYTNAISDFTKAIELNPKSGDIYKGRADVYYSVENWPLAIADYTRAIELIAVNETKENKWDVYSYSECYRLRGSSYNKIGDISRAFSDYSQAIEKNPKNYKAFMLRAIAYFDNQDYQNAVQDTTKVIELRPKEARAFALRSFSYARIGDYEKANEDYAMAESLGFDFSQ